MKKDINYADINSFLVLVEQGSFTKAAEQLQCSRSQISKQLAQLEKRLDVSLLVRTTRTQQLTAAGQAFYQSCKQSFVGIEMAIDTAKESTGELSGEIKINSVGGYIGENVIGAIVTDFMKAHPNIRVKLDFSSQRVDLVSGEFDFVFRMGELNDSNLIARKLTDLKIGTFVSPSYVSVFGLPKEPRDLEQHKCIAGSMRHWSYINSNGKAQQDVNVKGDLECKNGRVMLYSALSGNGIIRVPEIYCAKEVKNGELLPVFTDWQAKAAPFYLVYLQDKHQPARITAFKDFVVTNFGSYI